MNSLRLLFLTVLQLLFVSYIHAQILKVTPANPSADDVVTIIFDASQGNQILKDYTGEVYGHTGVILGTAEEPSGWKYVQGDWGTDDKRLKMEPIGKNKYRIRFHIRSFYGIPENASFLQMSFVFRNKNGSLVGKDENDADIYYPQLTKYENGPLEIADGIDGIPIGEIIDVESLADGSILLHGESQTLWIRSFGEDIVNFSYFPKGSRSIPKSEAVVLSPTLHFANVQPQGQNPIVIPLKGEKALKINLNPLNISITKNETIVYEEENGLFFDTKDENIGPMTGLRFRLNYDEHIYGTGSRATNIDKKGQRLYAYNVESHGYTFGEDRLNMSIPFLLSSRGYGIYFDSYRRGYFDIGATYEEIIEVGFKDTTLSYFLILGESPDEIVTRYTDLTGKQPLPPIWALGYIQSRQGNNTQEQVEEIVSKTIEAGFPLDAIVLDMNWYGGRRKMGNLDWAAIPFPRSEQMIQDFRKKGVKTLLISEPYVVKDTRYYNELIRKGLFTTQEDGKPYIIRDFEGGQAGVLDIFQPKTWDWFWPHYRKQIDMGIAGWSSDAGEPEKHPLSMRHSIGKAEEVHNIYSLYWARLLAHKFESDYPDQRFFNLTRSGFAGIQRYNIFPKSGNATRSWEAFRAQTSIMLGAGISGIGYMHSDLGGSTGTEQNEELYERWVQMGTFSPIMRIHGEVAPSAPEPIFFSQKTQEIVKKAIKLRYKLLPYNYTLAWENSTKGMPLARPLWYHYPNDDEVAKMDDQYLWGKNLLIAPIFEPGISIRSIYLPKGNWVSFWTDEVYSGNQWIEEPVYADNLPIYVRSGSFIPTTTPSQNTDAYMGDTLIIHHYPDLTHPISQEIIYQDDGNTQEAQESQAYLLTSLKSEAKKKGITLSLSAKGMGYKGLTNVHNLYFQLHCIQRKPKKVSWNGKMLHTVDTMPALRKKINTIFYDETKEQLHIHISWSEELGELKILGKGLILPISP